jgi:hypothetical protein
MPHRYVSFILGTNSVVPGSQKIHFRPDGRAIVVRDRNGVLRLLEVPSGKLLGQRSLDGPGVTRFSPDGRVVAAATPSPRSRSATSPTRTRSRTLPSARTGRPC